MIKRCLCTTTKEVAAAIKEAMVMVAGEVAVKHCPKKEDSHTNRNNKAVVVEVEVVEEIIAMMSATTVASMGTSRVTANTQESARKHESCEGRGVRRQRLSLDGTP